MISFTTLAIIYLIIGFFYACGELKDHPPARRSNNTPDIPVIITAGVLFVFTWIGFVLVKAIFGGPKK